MPESSVDAASQLRALMKERQVTARELSEATGLSTAWFSRRLTNAVRMKIEDYTAIREAIERVASSEARTLA